MLKRKIAFRLTVSALYLAGCFLLYFGTLNFDDLDLITSSRDFDYVADAYLFALCGSGMAAVPVVCLWLEFSVTRRFARLMFWWRRYYGCVIASAAAAVFLWFRSHAAVAYPYSDNTVTFLLIGGWYGLVLNLCIMRAHRTRLTSR
ncbi:hypothetical protein [Morganella sp. EGD-HP17]|uniref:hypothetical protein n=1 Tax=Morganella sp. EGD-HP17 TaxID=1435146 RepID=UPI00042A855A|nr:hypothetical protein [Morganella sp. EGD-HP17]ETO41277.1 hypothetical protein X965_10990 [Morganella sp. EGD-HP17]